MIEVPALELEDIHKYFGAHEVLKGVSLTAHKGEVISMIGSSGSGKSTFLRCINMLEIPTSGMVKVHGELIEMKKDRSGSTIPANAKQVERIRARLSMVFQSFNLWSHMTILQNIIEAPVHVLKIPKKQAVEAAEHLLQKVGIYERRDYYPGQLSGGQQQRAAIARALAVDPEVMLFDEPTSALDPELVGEVLKVMHDLAEEGRTMIIVTHEMSFARDVSNHVMFLHQGLIAEQGAPQELFNNPQTERLQQFLSTSY
ncbi:ABC transporter ATP-binding protein [Zooshikella ganghwensis]|uniref:ATP-binding cassette domain-containing protein n=1 Tax=Zooshikella ganghwensis TaxID=202772 RepID=A0A4P9VNT7_9GAMM|nr:ABC transporter ATP-binding protein [Zooshikella ganghwensis]RDH44566.1 ATP-binding cassette domain-containing protein [Zooshikella ganghwensis]